MYFIVFHYTEYNIHSTSTYAHTYHAVHQLHPPTDSGGLVATAEATAKAVTSKTEIQKERSTLQVAADAGILFRAQRCTLASQLNSRRNLRSHGIPAMALCLRLSANRC